MNTISVNKLLQIPDGTEKVSGNSQISIGKIVTGHGVHGEFKLKSHISREQAEKLIGKSVFINHSEFRIEKIKYQSVYLIMKCQKIDSLDQVKEYIKSSVWVNRQDLGKLPSDTYYVADLIDMIVFSVEGEQLGKIVNCISTGSNDVYIIRTNKQNQEIMIPAIKDVIKKIDLESKTMIVKLIEGLI